MHSELIAISELMEHPLTIRGYTHYPFTRSYPISGKYRKAGDGLFCKECPPGQYQKENGQEECNICPEDFYCPTPTEKVNCPDGAKCPEGSTAPIFCQNLFEYSDSKEVF